MKNNNVMGGSKIKLIRREGGPKKWGGIQGVLYDISHLWVHLRIERQNLGVYGGYERKKTKANSMNRASGSL